MSTPADVTLPSRRLDPAVAQVLKELKPGDRVTITHTVRVGGRSWPATATGRFRGVNYLSTGVTTDRVAADDIVVPTVHFARDDGELGSVALDEHTKIARA
jgi:hypothetical protein